MCRAARVARRRSRQLAPPAEARSLPPLDRPEDLARLLTSGRAHDLLDDDALQALRRQMELGYDMLRREQEQQARQDAIDLARRFGEQAVLDRQRQSDRLHWEFLRHRWPQLLGHWRRELRPALPFAACAAAAVAVYVLGQAGVMPGEAWEMLRESWPLPLTARSG